MISMLTWAINDIHVNLGYLVNTLSMVYISYGADPCQNDQIYKLTKLIACRSIFGVLWKLGRSGGNAYSCPAKKMGHITATSAVIWLNSVQQFQLPTKKKT